MGSTDTDGTRFGAYRLEKRLGAGGLAVVWRAVLDGPERFARTVALKRLSPELSRNPAFAQMLVTEARVSALLHHPAIAQVQDFGQVDGEYFIIMEFIEGHDLARVLKTCATTNTLPPLGVVTQIVAQLAAALAYVHELADTDGRPLEIVHRDVSPSNVMITDNGDIKLIDFGIARAAGHFRDDKTATGLLKGKIGYLSPEQAAGRPADRRSDIFALGVVMYEALVIRRLFRGVDALDTLRLVREADCAPPSTLRPEVPPELEAIVMRMLARDADDRYQSCHEIVHALRPLLHAYQGDTVSVRSFVQAFPPSALAAVDSDSDGTPPTAAIDSPPPSLPLMQLPRRRTGLWAGGIVAIAAAGIALWLGLGAPPPVAAPPVPVSSPSPVPVPVPVQTAVLPPPTAPAPPPPTVAAPPAKATPAAAKALKTAQRNHHHHHDQRTTPAPTPTAKAKPPAKAEELPELQRPF